MKNLKLILITLILSNLGMAQGFVQSPLIPPTCLGMCNGSVLYSTTVTPGPFTAVLSNTASCPNSTVQSSTGNSITISNLCTCAGNYTVNIYNSSMVLVASELLQVPITATAPLTLMTPTTLPAGCSTCCNASVFIGWSGGYAPTIPDATLTIDGIGIGSSYFPNPSVCVGSHTLCVTDLSNCQVCTIFTVGFNAVAGLKGNKANDLISISPNPTYDRVIIHSNFSEPFYSVKCFDLNGKQVLSSNESSGFNNNLPVDVSSLPAGIYFVELAEKTNQFIGRQKLVKLQQ